MVKEGKSKYPNKKAAKGKKLVTSIVVDDRERQVIPFFEEFADIRVSTARMTTGDYAIVIKSEDTGQYVPAVLFERKTWKDFADSIKDGRMENNSNLHELRKKLGCRVIFVVEGQPFPAPNRKFRGIPFKNIQKKIDRMTLVDEFQIIQTRDQKMTAKRIVDIAVAYDQYYDKIVEKTQNKNDEESEKKSEKKDKKKNKNKNKEKDNKKDKKTKDSPVDGGVELNIIPSELTQVRVKTNDRILQEMWISLPQVSIATAKILSEKWSISDIVSGKVFVCDIADLKYPSGTRIGEQRAKKILTVSQGPKKGGGQVNTLAQTIAFTKAQEKLLKSIHGVSAVVAKQICKKYTLKQLCEKVTESDLAALKRSDQPNARNLGPALAKKIIELLRSTNT